MMTVIKGIIILSCTIILTYMSISLGFEVDELTDKNLRITNEKLQSDSLLMIVSEDVIRLRKHVRINFILDSINNQNTHTKRIKQNHRELLNLNMD